MKCPTCNIEMQTRGGRFGEFYFCPNQYHGCTQKTITKHKPKVRARIVDDYTIRERKRVLKSLDCSEYDIYGDKIEVDPECEDSGFWDNSGEWFRPF